MTLFPIHIGCVDGKYFSRCRGANESGRKMKIASSIFLSLLAVAFVGAKVLPQKSPLNYVKCTKREKILWPDYSDKKFYFECVGENDFVKRPCPSKTVFNYHTQQCTWPEEWIQPPELSNLVEPLKSAISLMEFAPTCQDSELHLYWPDPEVPRDFFRCLGVGQSERLSCPDGNVFSFLLQMCVAEQTTTTSTTGRPIDRFPDCTPGELHLTWPDLWYPQNYVVCTGVGEFEVRECQSGSVFVFMLQMCVRGDGLTTTSLPITSTTQRESTTRTPHVTTPEGTTELMTTAVTTETSLVQTTTRDELQTAPTAVPHPFRYPKVKCLICWRPTCERHEMDRKWPDFDAPEKYFQCLKEGVMILKSCGSNSEFDFRAQRCVKSSM